MINHVYRSWWNPAEPHGSADQAIWRSYSITNAQDWYAKAVREYTGLAITPNAYTTLEPLFTPAEIEFRSQVADEFLVLCGVINHPICEAAALYRNYTVIVSVDWRRVGADGTETSGLTLEEFETALIEMDAVFAEFLAANPVNH